MVSSKIKYITNRKILQQKLIGSQLLARPEMQLFLSNSVVHCAEIMFSIERTNNRQPKRNCALKIFAILVLKILALAYFDFSISFSVDLFKLKSRVYLYMILGEQ